jgi:hypothetical protein
LDPQYKNSLALVDIPGLESLLPANDQPFAKCTMALAVNMVRHPLQLLVLVSSLMVIR